MNTFAFRFRQSRSCRWRSVSRKVCGVAHVVKSRWFDSENRVAGYALTNSLGRGVTATLAYDGSRMSGMAFALPNGGSFSTALTRNAARPDLVTRRAYSANGSSIYSYDTSFDLLGRPVNATDSQSLARSYLYNRRSELAAATIGTNAYEYAYDTIGNRTVASANSVTNTYAANNLNQYTQVDASQLTYDADGNLTQDDRFAYTYDAENRLLSVRPIAPVEGALAVVNAYDHDNRRILKRVERFVDDAWALVETHTFVYDGNNMVFERIIDADGSERIVENFWGNDLSGTEQGAGGVGGLLAVSIDGSFYFPCYDQIGNVVCYVSEAGAIAAQYVYDPYGSVIDQNGALADVFDIRFSTRYTDRETGLVSYKRRFYRPEHGRWLNRDPIEEMGGVNLYAFCLNNANSNLDRLGLNVTLTTGNRNVSWLRAGNRYFHQEICVDTWVWNEKSCCWRRTGRRSFSFAATGLGLSGPSDDWLGLNSPTGPGVIKGSVYETDDQGLEDTEVIETTPCQDRAFLKYLLSLDGKEDTYSLFRHNCRTFSQAMLDEAKRRNSNNDWRCKYDNKCN